MDEKLTRPIDNFVTHNPAEEQNAYRNRAVKDYSKDPNINGWQDSAAVHQSSVALQA